MDIRPIDMQLVINKAADVNKLNDNPRQVNENQYNFSEQFLNKTQHDNQKTSNSQRGEDENIQDGKGGNKGRYNSNRRKKKEKEEKESERNKSNSLFDVSI